MTFGEDEIRSITDMVWSTTLGFEVRPCPEWLVPDDAPGMVTAWVLIDGAWSGAMVLSCPGALAARVAQRIFDADYECANREQVADALGELVNQTGGNLKGLLPEPCTLSLPTVIDAASSKSNPSGRLTHRVAFECDGEPFTVSVLQRGATAEAHVE